MFWISEGDETLAQRLRVRVLAVVPFVLSLALFVFTYLVYERLPALLPIHWNLALQPDFFIPRQFIVVFLGLDVLAAVWASYSVLTAGSIREASRPYWTFLIVFAVCVIVLSVALVLY